MTRQKSPVWHPFTQHALMDRAIDVVRTSGCHIETADGRRILDAISSWWVITHGHRHPRIMEAIGSAARELDQVIFAGFTHDYAETCARDLVSIAPSGLEHVFFSDSGSTAVEVAVKMALGTYRNTGQSRTRLVVMEHGYHGDTVGTMSAGERGVFNQAYESLLYDVTRIAFPRAGEEQATLDALDAALADRRAAALLIEPLVLGAGGMLFYAPRVLTDMKRICEQYDTLLIADEVMTGFGRTGAMFACERAQISPDILCLAKGLTGGALPLAATLASARVFEAHYSKDRTKTLFHSSSYTANPLACAAACANLAVWRDEPVLARIAALETAQAQRLAPFFADKRFASVRQIGTITALDLAVADAGYLADVGPALYAAFLARDVLLRPLGNTIYVMPPYCTTGDDLDRVYAAIDAAAAEVIVTATG